MNFFNPDSPIMRFLEKIGNLIILNLVMIICCIPIVTIGPAVTAAHWVTLKLVRDEEGGIVQDFLHSFRVNLKQGIGVGMIALVVGTFLGLEIYWIYQISQFGGLFDKFVFLILVFVMAVFLMTMNYVWPVLAKFNNTTKQLFRTSFALAVRHIVATLVMGVISIAPALMLLYSPASMALAIMFYLFIGFAAIAYLQSIFMVRIFDQYLPSDPDESDEEAIEE